jgi:hypothetical protein
VGTYAQTPGNCIVRSPCVRLTDANAVYTTAGTTKDNCDWGCNAGFYIQESGCAACAKPTYFDPLLHTFTGVCNTGCLPGICSASIASLWLTL